MLDNLKNLLDNNEITSFIGLSFFKSSNIQLIDDFYILGKDYEGSLVIDSNSGYVFSIYDSNRYYINRSLNTLFLFISRFNDEIDFNDKYDEENRSEKVKRLKFFFKNEDELSVKEDYGWWSFILEQVEDGIL